MRVPGRFENLWPGLTAGAVATAGGTGLLFWLLPDFYTDHTILPFEGGLFLGTLVGLFVAGARVPRARQILPLAALTLAVTTLLVLGFALKMSGLAFSTADAALPKGVASGAALAVWLVAWLVEWRKKRRIAVFTALLVGLSLAALTFENARYLRGTLAGERIQEWNVYHYYMGSKYFKELGYSDLYAAHLAADDEWIRSRPPKMDGRLDFDEARHARSMETYRLESRRKLIAGYDRSAFTDARWEEFGRDLRNLRPRAGEIRWSKVVKDLGYNPPPVWSIVGTTASSVVDIDSRSFYLIGVSDVPLHLLALVAMVWAFGLRPAAVAVLFATVLPANWRFLVGGFLRYDWVHMAIISVACFKQGWFRCSGIALSWAAMTRVFPGFFVIPIAVRMIWALIRGGPSSVKRSHVEFITAFCVACTVLFVASHFTGRGLGVWGEWIENITLHSHLHPVTSNKRFGVPRLALHKPAAEDWERAGYGKGAWIEEPGPREHRLEESRGRKHLYQVVGLCLLLPALIRRKDLDAMLLMLFAAFLFVCMSRYYATIWMLLLMLGSARPRDRGTPWPAVLCGAGLLWIVTSFFIVDGATARYYLANYEVFAMFAALCIGYIAQDLLRWRRRTP